jgi:hypothetical protein
MKRRMKERPDLLFLIIHTAIYAEIAATLYFQFNYKSAIVALKSVLYG